MWYGVRKKIIVVRFNIQDRKKQTAAINGPPFYPVKSLAGIFPVRLRRGSFIKTIFLPL